MALVLCEAIKSEFDITEARTINLQQLLHLIIDGKLILTNRRILNSDFIMDKTRNLLRQKFHSLFVIHSIISPPYLALLKINSVVSLIRIHVPAEGDVQS